jgi:hypothetical protein
MAFLGKKTAALLAFGGLVAISAAANAAIINSQFVSGLNQIEDTDLERVMRGDTAVTSGNFQVGDVIQTILRFNTVNVDQIGDVLPSPYQLNAYSELKITAILDPTDPTKDCTTSVCTLVFGATGNLGTDAVVALYERTSAAQPGFDQTVAPATAIANIQAETLIATIGFGESDDFWTSTTLLNIGTAAGLQQGDPQASNGEFGLSLLANPGGLPIMPNGILSPIDNNLHDIVGNASIYQRNAGANTGWLVSSNTSARFLVPEPASLLLLGVGLMAAFGVTRRRRDV